MKETSSSFAFGEWGTSWNTSGFSGGNTGITDITDTTKETSIEDSSFWSLGIGSKSKKKMASPGFDFGDLSTTNEAQEEQGALGNTKVGGNDERAEIFAPAGKKDKKNKKKSGFGFEDTPNEPESVAIGDSKPEAEAAGEDTWAGIGWGASATKSTKKKGKKAEAEPKTSEFSPISPQTPAAPIAPVEDEGPAFGSRKDKKKKPKAISEELEGFKETAAEEALEPEAEVEPVWGSRGKKDKKKDKKGAIEQTVSHEETAVAQETEPAAEDNSWGIDTKKGSKKTKKNPWDEGYGADLASALAPEPATMETSWATGARKGSKKTKKNTWEEPIETPEVFSVPEFGQRADPVLGFGTKEDSKKKPKKGALDESDTVANSFFAFEAAHEDEPEAESIWGSGSKKDNKKKAKKGVADESDKAVSPVLVFGNEPEPGAEIEPSWGFGTAKKDNKKKPKKGVIDKPDEGNPVVSSLAKLEPEPGHDWSFGNANHKKKTKKGTFDEPDRTDDPIISPVVKPEPQTDFSWDYETNKDNKKQTKKGGFEEFGNEEDPVLGGFPNPEPDLSAGWGGFGVNTSKAKGKKGILEEAKQADDSNLIDIPEKASPVEKMADTWGIPTKKDKKSKRGQVEVKEAPVRAPGTMPNIETPAAFANDAWPDWGGDKKKDKKGKKGTAGDVYKEEPSSMQSPPSPAGLEPPASSFDYLGGAKKEKEKKGKKGKPVEPEFEPEPMVDRTIDIMSDDAYNEGNDLGDWEFSAKDKTKEKEMGNAMEWEPRVQEQNEMYEQAEREKVDKVKDKEKVKPGKKGKSTNSTLSKSKDSNTDPVPNFEADNWGSWDSPKTDKKPIGKKDIFQAAPPPAPTPPAQGLTPEPTPSPITGLDDMGEADWGNSFAPMKSKGKKDGKKPTKAEEPKSDKKATKDKAGELLAEPPKNKTKNDAKKGAAKEETPAKAARGIWGSMGFAATSKSKAIEEEKVEEEDYGDEDNYKDETNDLIDFEMGADSMADLVDESGTKGSKTKADGKLGKVISKESDKSGKSSEKKKKGNAPNNSNNRNNFMTEVPDVAVKFNNWDNKFNNGNETGEAEAEGEGDGEGNGESEMPNKDDVWSFWGTSKKTSGLTGKKTDEPKKEITKQSWTNPIASLNGFSNQPEPSFFDDQPEPPKTTTATTNTKTSKATTSTMKPSVKSTVAQRVKALEKERLEKEKEKALVPISDPALDQFEPLAKLDSPPKKVSPFGKSKVTPAGKGAASKKKDPSPPPLEETVAEKQVYEEFVPGSFPAEGADDDITDVIPTPPVAKKTNKKTPNPKKEPKTNLMDFDIPAPSPTVPDVPEVPEIPDMPEVPPTPPPEPVAPKPIKKERARVRDEGISSWGFWGASPRKPVKKETKTKDDGDLPITTAKERAPATGLVRSKSTKTAKEKETEKVSAKSSGSDKDKKAESRPAKSRGSSFGGFWGGPPPPRTRPVRKQSVAASKNASRRQSVDVEAMGLPSPPAELAPEMNSKAAKLMGTSGGKPARKERGPPKASGMQSSPVRTDFSEDADRCHLVVPDPYAIDDDDMVMVGGLEYPIVSDPSPNSKGLRKDKNTNGKAKKEVRPIPPPHPGFTRSKRSPPNKQVPDEWSKADVLPMLNQVNPAPEPADDIVMVEAGPSSDGAELPSLQEALAFAKPPSAPAPLQRSPTTAKKSDSKLMGFFGLRKTRRASEMYERPRNKEYIDDDVNLRQKRTVGGVNDATKRVRRDDRKVRRSERPDVDADGFVTDAPLEREAAEDVETKNEERRSKRASRSYPVKEYRDIRSRDDGDQRAKLQEADQGQDDVRRGKTRESRDRRSRREEQEAAIRKEERRTKRAAREERVMKDEPLSRDIDPSSAFEGRSKHRDRDLLPENSSRPRKSDRHRSHVDTPKSPDATERRPRRDERRSSRRTPGEKSSSHRKSTAAPVDDYFDPRNGAAGDIPGSPPFDPAPRGSEPVDSVPLDPVPLDPQEPYMHSGANEHTSSWVKSQISEPPPPPPLEPSVLDPAPVLGGVGDESTVDEDARRAMRRQSKRKSRYTDGGGGGDGDGERRRRRESRRETVRSSEGSAEQERERPYRRRKSDYGGGVPLRGYGPGGGGMGGKRESWFQKIKGLADVR